MGQWQEWTLPATVHDLDARTCPSYRVQITGDPGGRESPWIEILTGRDRILLAGSQAYALYRMLREHVNLNHPERRGKIAAVQTYPT